MIVVNSHIRKLSYLIMAVSTLMALMLFGCDKDNGSDGTEIFLNKNELYLEVGKSERLVASFDPFDASNLAHKWSSSDNNVAIVDETGKVTAVKTGTAVIMARALSSGNSAKCNVTVIDKVISVTGISLDRTKCEIAVGSQITLNATIKPANASNQHVKWISDDSSVATVDSEGDVCALAVGTAGIKAVTEDGGKVAICTVTVVPKGVKFTLPTVKDITSNSALIEGCIEPKGVDVSEMGICYAIKSNPTVDDAKIPLLDATVTCTIKNLKPETDYYVRFYAVVGGKISYSDQSVFETLPAVAFNTPTISDISSNSAVVKGVVNSNGSILSETGIVYSKEQNPTINDNKVSVSNEEFEYTLYNLETYTSYYLRLYSVVDDSVYYSDEVVFTTAEELFTHFKAISVYEDELFMISDAPKGYSSVNVCYGTEPNPKVTDNISTAYVDSSGKFCLRITGLKANTTYYLRSYIKEGDKFIYTDDEVELNTIGEKNIWASTMTYSFCRIGSDYSNQFSFEAKINLETVLEGEFYWKAKDGNYLSKSSILTSSNKVKELYFEGNNQFIYQIIYTTPLYTYPTVTFNKIPREIIHMPTGVKYYVNVPSNNKTYKTGDVPYVGYDK